MTSRTGLSRGWGALCGLLAAALAQFSVTIKFDLKRCQFLLPCYLAWRDWMAGSDQQRPVQAICGDRIGGREFPVWENRLHNLIAECDPADAVKERVIVHARGWRRRRQKGRHPALPRKRWREKGRVPGRACTTAATC